MRSDRGSPLCFGQKGTGLHQAERYFLISMKRIAELGGKLGYLVIMSRSERDNKSSRVQATLSRSDCSLGRIRTNWILMRDILVECKMSYWKACKMSLNSNFISKWEREIQTAIVGNTFNKTWKGDKTTVYIGRFILSVYPFWLVMHILSMKEKLSLPP